jgi:hypothetical protein
MRTTTRSATLLNRQQQVHGRRRLCGTLEDYTLEIPVPQQGQGKGRHSHQEVSKTGNKRSILRMRNGRVGSKEVKAEQWLGRKLHDEGSGLFL